MVMPMVDIVTGGCLQGALESGFPDKEHETRCKIEPIKKPGLCKRYITSKNTVSKNTNAIEATQNVREGGRCLFSHSEVSFAFLF